MGGKFLIWGAALIAIPMASAFSEDLPSRARSPASILARMPVYDLSEFYLNTDAGVGWHGRNGFLRAVRLGYDFRSSTYAIAIESTPRKNGRRWRQIEMGAALMIPAANKNLGALDQAGLTVFGGLAPIAAGKLPAPAIDLATGLARMGADDRTHDTPFGRGEALLAGADAKNLVGMGAVIQGLNVPLPAGKRPDSDNSAAAAAPIQAYPMSAAVPGDQQNRATK